MGTAVSQSLNEYMIYDVAALPTFHQLTFCVLTWCPDLLFLYILLLPFLKCFSCGNTTQLQSEDMNLTLRKNLHQGGIHSSSRELNTGLSHISSSHPGGLVPEFPPNCRSAILYDKGTTTISAVTSSRTFRLSFERSASFCIKWTEWFHVTA